MSRAATIPIDESESFVTLLRRHRMAAGLTQTVLARKLRVTQSTIGHWESGSSLPRADRIPVLARVLNIDAMQLTRVLEPEMAGAKD